MLGVKVDAIDYEAAVDAVVSAADAGHGMAVTCTAVHGVALAALDPGHRHRLNTFDVIVPDGQPVRWALGWLHGAKLGDRVRGVDFMLRICESCAARDVPIFLYGSRPDVLAKLSANLRRAFPALVISGSKPSMFRTVTDQERIEIAEEIRASGCRLVFVGLGCPRQEYWIFENRDLLPMPLIGIGSAFDAHAGVQSVPPLWMQHAGLEWLWRLVHEPRRLWKRYLLLNPYYLAMIAGQLLKVVRLGPGPRTPPPPTRVG